MLARTRPLGFDPFKGYRRKERNVRDLRVREAIKEIAQMDGAFVVARDGTVEAACRLIDAPMTGLTLPKGLGTRHWAAAAITDVTKALAVVVSQSNGTVRLFQNGEVILRIAPMRHARAMKWQDAETEPAPPSPRAERDREKDERQGSRPGKDKEKQTRTRTRKNRRGQALSRRLRLHPGLLEHHDSGSFHAGVFQAPGRTALPLHVRPAAGRYAAFCEPGLPGGPIDDDPLREDRARGLVLVADGVGGLDLCGTALRYVLGAEGLPYAVHVFPWGHGFGRWFADLTSVTNRDAKAGAAGRRGAPVSRRAAARSGLPGRQVGGLGRGGQGPGAARRRLGRARGPAGAGLSPAMT